MKKVIFLLPFLTVLCQVYSQNYDLVVKSSGDSIACRIDSITDSHIYFEIKHRNYWIKTNMYRNEVIEYKHEAIDSKEYVFKPGTSFILGTKKQLISEKDIHKNTILFANDHIFSVTISYERIIALENNWAIMLRGGTGYTAESGDDWAFIGQASMNYGISKHFFETGIAYYQNLTFPDGFIIPLSGYRFMGRKGFIFRAYGTILIDIIDHSEWGLVNPGFHLSLGYRLKR